MVALAIALVLGLDGWALITVDDGHPRSRPESEVAVDQSPEAFLTADPPGAPEQTSGNPDSEPRPAPAMDEPATNEGQPSAAALPRPGTYTWRGRGESVSTFSSTTKHESHEDEHTARYEVLPGPDGDRRVRSHQDYQQSKDGDFTRGGSSYGEQAWRPEGVFNIGGRSHSKGTDSSGHSEEWTNGCDWTPPIPELTYPLAPGSTWSWASSCTDENDDTVVLRQEVKGTARIEGWQSIEIDGVAVSAVRIHRTEERTTQSDFRNAPPGSGRPEGLHGRSVATQWFAPSAGLVVRSDTRTVLSRPDENRSDDFEQRSHHTSELVSLTPS